jgi:uncharacterized protein YndB with AHSA1/START domain
MTTRPANLPHLLERSLVIRARPETIFRFFTDASRWASWWGEGSSIEPRAGGRVVIRYPGGTEVHGEVIEISPPERLTFTYGYAKGTPIAPGASLVTITLSGLGASTQLQLTHAFSDPAVRDEHVQGWRYQLSLFANVIADELHSNAAALVDAWFAAWGQTDDATRRAALSEVVAADVMFRDRFSAVDGIDDLDAHLQAAGRFMPGISLVRVGEVRHCQGVALADWIARGSNGDERARGSNVFVLNSDGRIESVTGLWSRHPQS